MSELFHAENLASGVAWEQSSADEKEKEAANWSFFIFKTANERANAYLDRLLASTPSNNENSSGDGSFALDLKYQTEEERIETAKRCRELRRRHASKNFTYGDTRFDDFQDLLVRLDLKPGEEVFVDLGCGIGECLFAAALLKEIDLSTPHNDIVSPSTPELISPLIQTSTQIESISSQRSATKSVFRKVIGVDLMFSKIEECRMTWRMIEELFSYKSSSVTADSCSTISSPALTMSESNDVSLRGNSSLLPEVTILEEDFFEIDLSESTIIYACATCFTSDTIRHIIKAGLTMKSGSKVIILDKPLDYIDTESSSTSDLVKEEVDNGYNLLFTHECKTSWGIGVAYVYKRK